MSSVDAQVAQYADIFGLKEHGKSELATVVSYAGEDADVGNVAQAFNAVYQAGKQGKDVSEAKNPYLSLLSEEQKMIAYNAGVMDGLLEKANFKKSSGEVLQNDGENGKEGATTETSHKRKGRTAEERQEARKKQIEAERRNFSQLSPERQKYLKEKYSEYCNVIEQLEVGDKLISDNGDTIGEVISITDGAVFIVGESGFVEMILPDTFIADGVISFLDIGDGHFEKPDGTWIGKTTADNAETASKKITPDMSDAERYEVLKDRILSLSAQSDKNKLVDVQEKIGVSDNDIEFSKYGDRKKLFKKLGEEFAVYHQYSNADVQLDFSFSKGNIGESVSKQGKNFLYMAKMLTCLDTIVENAIGIEVHNRNKDGYKTDNTLENIYVLASAFVDGENIVPVKLEIKKFSDKENTLYVAIALESIKTDGIVKQEVANDGVARQYSPPSNISIAHFFEKINIADKSFLKYIPDGFLSEEQIKAKQEALAEDKRRIDAMPDKEQQSKENAIEPERVVYSSKKAMAYDAVAENQLDAEQKKAVSIGKDIGRKVVIADTRNAKGVRVDGFLGKDGVIYISKYNKSPVAFIFKHELAHFCERAGQKYRDFMKAVQFSATFKRWLKQKGYNSMLEYNSQIRKERAEIGIDPGEDGANNEIIANFVAEMMFGDETTIADKLIGELKPKQRRSVRQFLRDFLDWIKSRFTGKGNTARSEILRLEKMFGKAFRTAVNVEQGNGEQFVFQGYAEDGRGKYKSNFPKGTPKMAKAQVILNYIQNVWSKKPISLQIVENGEVRTIQAQFDPTYDETENIPTDASKLMGGNRHGTSSDQRVTLDLADDYYQLASESTYNYSKDETGKDNPAHKDVNKWHYFINDIYFAEHNSEEYVPYRVTINIKEKNDGTFVYSFSAENQERLNTPRTLHAVVKGDVATPNVQPSNFSISDSDEKNNSQNAQNFGDGTEQFSYNPQNDTLKGDRHSSSNFVEDKYYSRQIDKFETLKQGGYITVGKINEGSPLDKVGIPHGSVYFDVSKILQEMKGRGDAIPVETMKYIPQVLDNPIVITEYVDRNGMHSVNVYGNLFLGNSPVVIGVMIAQTQKGNIISKIQTVHPNRNAIKEMTDSNILYLSENKKETKLWFQSLGTQMLPLGGNKFGFIRSISQSDAFVNSNKKEKSLVGVESFSYNPQNDKIKDVFERLRNGEISLNEAEKLLKKPEKDNPFNIANTKKEDMSTTPKLNKKTTGNVGDGDSKFADSIQITIIFDQKKVKRVRG